MFILRIRSTTKSMRVMFPFQGAYAAKRKNEASHL